MKQKLIKIGDEKWDVTRDTTGIKRIIRKYYKQPYANKSENQLDRFLDMHNLEN